MSVAVTTALRILRVLAAVAAAYAAGSGSL